jgi:hypothetical protein
MTGHTPWRNIKRKISLATFREYHASWCETLAECTRESVDLYRGPDGLPRIVLAGWPCVGWLVGRFGVGGPQTESQEQV